MDLLDRNKVPLRQYRLIVTAPNWTTSRAIGIPYQTLDGAWRLRFNITGSASSGTAAALTFTVQGVTFHADEQAFSFIDGNITSRFSDQFGYGTTVGSSSNLTLAFASSISLAFTFKMNGDVELDSKPTFME